MTEGDVRVLFCEMFKGEGGHGGRCAEAELEWRIVTEFEVAEVKSSFFSAGEDRDYARGRGFGQEWEEVIDSTKTSIIIESGEDLDSLGSF